MKRTQKMLAVWPERCVSSSLPLAPSHRHMLVSSEPEASIEPAFTGTAQCGTGATDVPRRRMATRFAGLAWQHSDTYDRAYTPLELNCSAFTQPWCPRSSDCRAMRLQRPLPSMLADARSVEPAVPASRAARHVGIALCHFV
jgi:hypothetical protein